MNKKSAFSPSDSPKGEPEKATNENKMNESILKYKPESPLSGDLGVNCELAKPESGHEEPGRGTQI